MKIYMVRFTSSDGRGIKKGEYHKYTYGGAESTPNPHQAWQTSSLEKAETKMADIDYLPAAEVVIFSED